MNGKVETKTGVKIMIIHEYSLVGFALNPYAKKNENKNPGIKMNNKVKIPNVFSHIKQE